MQDRDRPLNTSQEDFLCELGNIGTGHALTSLSKLAQITLDMSLPAIGPARAGGMAARFAIEDDAYIGVRIDAWEDLEFSVTMLMNKAFADRICLTLSGQAPADLAAMDAVNASCLAEIGNILCNAFVNVISAMFSRNLQTTEAVVRAGPRDKVLAELFGEDAERLFVDDEITCEGPERAIHMLFALDGDMTKKALALMEN